MATTTKTTLPLSQVPTSVLVQALDPATTLADLAVAPLELMVLEATVLTDVIALTNSEDVDVEATVVTDPVATVERTLAATTVSMDITEPIQFETVKISAVINLCKRTY